jgi:hypothetical protein
MTQVQAKKLKTLNCSSLVFSSFQALYRLNDERKTWWKESYETEKLHLLAYCDGFTAFVVLF